jgi:hypothetical protein
MNINDDLDVANSTLTDQGAKHIKSDHSIKFVIIWTVRLWFLWFDFDIVLKKNLNRNGTQMTFKHLSWIDLLKFPNLIGFISFIISASVAQISSFMFKKLIFHQNRQFYSIQLESANRSWVIRLSWFATEWNWQY